MNQERSKCMLFGLPIDNVTLDEAVEDILNLVHQYRQDHTPKYVATVNSDFFSQAWGWGINRPRYAELLRILQQADLITADGMPLVWLSKWLGKPLKERVTGQDLFPLVAKAVQNKKGSVYLLGGGNKIAWKAGDILKKKYPDLRIVGISAPTIHIQGDFLENAAEKDRLIVESINEAAPDILFIQLGNPKQEIWFDRIRAQLKVPVSIGIGGSFERYAGAIPRAPDWMQKAGLEWLFRVIYEPRRLWKRYFSDFFKYIYSVTPLILFQSINTLMYHLTHNNNHKTSLAPNLLFLSPKLTISVVELPEALDEKNSENFMNLIQEAVTQDVVVMDFQKLRWIDLVGLAKIFQIWKDLTKKGKEFYGLFLSKDMQLLFKLHRLWPLLSGRMCSDSEAILQRLKARGPLPILFESIHHQQNKVVISFFGRLDNQHNYDHYLQKFLPIIHEKDVVLNLAYCTAVDNAGCAFLMNFKAYQEKMERKFEILGVNPILKKQFKLAQIPF